MKIFVQSAAFLAVLLGSGLSQAATTTASIPMGLEVPKSCTFSNVSAGIVVPEDGTKARGSFTLRCNTGSFSVAYTANSHADGSTYLTNSNSTKLKTIINFSLNLFLLIINTSHSYLKYRYILLLQLLQ